MTTFFQILGHVRVRAGSDDTEIHSPPVRGLLAALLMEGGHFVGTEQLALALWNDPPRSAPSNLRLHIARLRSQLEQVQVGLSERLVTRRGSYSAYRLHAESHESDYSVFKQLVVLGCTHLREGAFANAEHTLCRALSLWRGPAGQDCTVSDRLRIRLDAVSELHVTACERLTEARLGLGRTTDLIPEIQRVLSIEPLREMSWANLIRACYLGGDVAGAFGAFERASSTYRDQLGLEPSAGLLHLQMSMLRRDENALREFTLAG